MLIVTIILTILAIFLCLLRHNDEGIAFLSGVGAVGLGIIDVIIVIYVIGFYFDGFTIQDKINMYKDENKNIETQIQTIVSEYKDYESSTMEKFVNESPTVLISLFPELKTNDLVNKQIDIYLANNNKIKELKEKQIQMKIGKWLLYFGK